MTPPTETPKKRWKQKAKRSVCQKKSQAPNSLALQCVPYQGNMDYPGKDDLGAEEKELLDELIRRGITDNDAVVYNGNDTVVFEVDLFRMIWGQTMQNNVFEAYAEILNKGESNHKVYLLSYHAVRESMQQLEKYPLQRKGRKKNPIKKEIQDFVTTRLSSNIRVMLGRLNEEVLSANRYIIFPLNTHHHWHMLVLDTETKEFTAYNSMKSSSCAASCRNFARFIRTYLEAQIEYSILKETINEWPCPQQHEESSDCGAYFCLFMECLACGDPEFWNTVREMKINYYRAHLAAKILQAEQSRNGDD